MRKWINAINVLNEGLFDFLKSDKTPKPSEAPAPMAARKHFGLAGVPKQPVQTNKQALRRALDDISMAVAWTGVAGSDEVINRAARKYGVSPDAIRKAITPEVVRNWQRRG